MASSLIYTNKVPSSYRTLFINKVQQVAHNLNIDPHWLMAVINFESAGSFSPAITNSLGYTGLIQFGSTAAKDLGTTTAALRSMTAVRQLDFVEMYYKQWYKRLRITKPDSFVDMYLITLFPVAVNKPDNFILQTKTISAARMAAANGVFDLNRNHQITVAEIQHAMLKKLPTEWVAYFVKKKKGASWLV